MIFVGVDIGSCALKAVAIKKNKKSFDVLRTHFFSWTEETQDDTQKIRHLKTLKSLYPERETRYIFCLSQNEISVELLRFPFKERYKILKSLPYQLESKLSLFDYKNLISDIKMAGFSGGKRDVLVFSGFKKNIAHLLNLTQSAGIKPFILTCSASSIANLFELKKENPPAIATENKNEKKENPGPIESDIYLKIGHTHTMALIFSQNQLKNVYSFEWGVVDCIRKISLKYEIPFSKAFEQFCEKAFVVTHTEGYTGSQIAFSKAIQEGFNRLIDKMRMLLLQLEGENIYKCKKIYIFGGGAQVRNLQALFSSHFNLPVERVENPVGFPDWNFRSNNNKQNNLITALGTAMEGFKKPRNPAVNFLKEEFAPIVNPFSVMFHEWRKPLLLGACAFILLSVYSAVRNHQAEQLANKTHVVFQKQSARVMKLSQKKISIKRVKKFIDSKKQHKQAGQLTEALSQTPSALDTMKNLSSAIKKQESWKLEIQHLNIEGNKIEIQGTVNPQNLPELRKNLRDISVKGSLKSLSHVTPPVPSIPPVPSASPAQNKQKIDKTGATENKLVSQTEKDPLVQFFKYSFIQKKG